MITAYSAFAAPPREETPPKDRHHPTAVSTERGGREGGDAEQATWRSANVGKVYATRPCEQTGSTFIVYGAGRDYGGNGDCFHFVYRPLRGDAEIVARVAEVGNTFRYAKAGVMIRETLETDSRGAFLFVTPGRGLGFMARTGGLRDVKGRGTPRNAEEKEKAPYWVKLVRKGNTFTAWTSPDGESWTRLTRQDIRMSDYAYVGLAVSSHHATDLNKSIFENVDLTGTLLSDGQDPAVLSADEPANRSAKANMRSPELKELDALADKLRAERGKLVFPKKKKLINVGWDRPSPAYLAANVREMEKTPFDGVSIKLTAGQAPFVPGKWDEEKFIEDYQNLSKAACSTFTDNFIRIHCQSPLDWFNEKHWQAVLHNARIIARAALLGRCAGICFDPECYGASPWRYQTAQHRDTKDFEKYEARVRQCGEEWMRVVQAECPNPRVLTMFLTPYKLILGADPNLPLDDRRVQVRQKLSQHHYALLPAFANGMLRGASPGTVLIDGNESAFYYSKREQYEKFATVCREEIPLIFIDDDLQEKYRRQVQVGSTWYADFYYGDFPRIPSTLSDHMIPDERARWAEHNAYWALKTADEYVWQFAEGTPEKPFDWWKGYLPHTYEKAVRSARSKVAANQSLGFESEEIFAGLIRRAKDRSPQATLTRLPGGTDAPIIDGNLNDKAWENAYGSQDFLPQLDWHQDLQGKTKARLCYDDKALYIAFLCHEPNVRGLKKGGDTGRRELGVCKDDSVHVLVPTLKGEHPMYWFAVNAGGRTLDIFCTEKDLKTWDASYKPKWQQAVHVGEDSWTVEIAIPWDGLQMPPPKPGARLRLNLARFRAQRSHGERSSWSPTLSWPTNFLEPEVAATVLLK
ncbi:MAG: carbohydrate-binding family 9-like protein [Planctomycetes bacterium]|nr:carbohydrate-binding family 9-like protein [Planctomycetota bacterium]